MNNRGYFTHLTDVMKRFYKRTDTIKFASTANRLRPVFKFSNRRAARDRNHWICEVTPELRKNLMERQRLFVDFNSCRVNDHLGIKRWYKWQGLGHVAKKCRQQDDMCSHCAENGHQRRECPHRQEPPRCAVCRRYGRIPATTRRQLPCTEERGNEPDSPNRPWIEALP